MLSRLSVAFEHWRDMYLQRKQFTGRTRTPFYVLARKYIPRDKDAVIVDIGGGDGGFLRNAGLTQSSHAFLLDGNPRTISQAKSTFKNALVYRPPDRLPFDDSAVAYIHTSHLVEHLDYPDLHGLMKEIDRVLVPKGVLVISAPLLWREFYGNLTHIKPYSPDVFIKYLCKNPQQLSLEPISRHYIIVELKYRYDEVGDEQWGGENIVVDLSLFVTRKIIRKMGFRRYVRTGYTLVLEKRAE